MLSAISAGLRACLHALLCVDAVLHSIRGMFCTLDPHCLPGPQRAGKANSAKNVFYNCDNKVVYYTAGLGVVYDREPHTQSFFHGHNDDISAIALCPTEVEFGRRAYTLSSRLPPLGSSATWRRAHMFSIWDTTNAGSAEEAELQRIEFRKQARGFCALGFSPTGEYLTIVTMDDSNSVYVYDWRNNVCLCESEGFKGHAPTINGVEWNPYEAAPGVAGSFVTFGRRHLGMWTSADGQAWLTARRRRS